MEQEKKKKLDIHCGFNLNTQYWGAWLHTKKKGFYDWESSPTKTISGLKRHVSVNTFITGNLHG